MTTVIISLIWLTLVPTFFDLVDKIDTQFIQSMPVLSAAEAAVPALVKIAILVLPIVAIIVKLRGWIRST